MGKYNDNGISLSLFEDCVEDLDLVDDENLHSSDVPSFFKEATAKESNADLNKFMEALALLSIKRFPDGLNEDFSAALARLLDYLGPDEDDESLKKKRLAVIEAKKRAIARAKEKDRQKWEEIFTKEDEEKKAEQKKREEKESLDAEERKLEQTKLRKKILKQALKRSKDRVAEFEKKEKEAEEQKKALEESQATDPAELQKKVEEAEDRVKRAKQARLEFEKKQKKQKEYEEKLKKKREEKESLDAEE